jgi:hypothetical protein
MKALPCPGPSPVGSSRPSPVGSSRPSPVGSAARAARLMPMLLGALASLALSACAGQSARTMPEGGKVTPQMRSGGPELRAFQIEDWIAPDDRTLIVTALDRSLYRARFKGRCSGMRLADTIAFVVQEPLRIDKYSGVVLPDGTRCAFASITRLTTPPAANP